MTGNCQKPALRFKGFTDAWEQHTVGHLFQVTRGYVLAVSKISNQKTEEMPYPVYSSQTHNNGLLGYYKDYLFNTAITWTTDGANAGTVNYRSEKFYSTNVNGVLLSENGNANECVAEILNLVAWKYVSHVGNPKLMNIVMSEIKINIPATIEEQQKISVLLMGIGSLITIHQHKYDKLTNIKKSMLEKLFPEYGSNVPKIRFSGFTDAWEQCELANLADIVGGGTPSTGIEDYWNGNIDWYSPVEIGEQIFVNGSQKKITKLGLQNSSAKILPIGTVLFTSRAGIGNTAVLAKQGSTNQGFQSIVPHKDKLESYFIFSRANELKKYGETIGAGSTFIEVSGKQMAKMPIFVPNFTEQMKIGNFFRKIDSLITLHQRELEKLKNVKKALLGKMFF